MNSLIPLPALLLVLLLLTLPLSAQTTTFIEADRAFNTGEITKAQTLYLQLAEQAKSSQRPLDQARALEGLAAAQMVQGQRKQFRTTYSEVSSLRRRFAPDTPSSQDRNLVVGGDFEDGLQPPWGTGHYESGNFNFGIWWNSKTCKSYAKTDSQIKHQGQSSLRITNFTPPGAHLFGTTSQRIRGIKPNTLYELSVWAKAQDIEPNAVQFVMDAGWHIRPLALPGGTYGWRPFTVQFNSGDLNFVDLRVLILNTGTVWLDQISLRELAEDEVPTEGLLAADTLFRKGRLLEALEAYRKLAPSPAVNQRTAQTLAALGRYGEALTLYWALKRRAGAELAIGDIYLKLGQPAKAAEHFLTVYDVSEDDQSTRAKAADRLALAYLHSGDLSKAISWQGEALTVMTHINDPHGRSLALFHLARIHHEAGQAAQAERRLKDSLPLAQATGDRTLESDILTLRAILVGEKKNYATALVDLEKAVHLKREVFDRYGLLLSLYWQGRFLEKSGQAELAIRSLEEAASILDDVKEASAIIKGSGETLLQNHARIYEDLTRLYLQMGQKEKALETLSRSRSAELNRVFRDKASSLKTEDKEVLERVAVLRSEKNALENSLKEQLSVPEDSRDEEEVEVTRQEREKRMREYREFLRSLFLEHPELAGLISVHPKQLRLKQKRLEQGEAILEYLCGEEHVYIFLVTPDELEVRVVELPRARLQERILLLLRAVRDDALGIAEQGALEQQSHELYELLLNPLWSHLEGVQTLGILPNGPLHYLPFQMLVTDPDGPTFLVDEMACLNMCEESFLAPPEKSSAVRKLLLLGNPDGTLGNAEMEVQNIAKIFPGSEVHVGSQATKDKLYPEGLEFQGLHIATHGVFDHEDAARSYLSLAPAGSENESRLTVGEIWGMDLEGFELVTLSACLTGLGEENPGDDLISLENAFLYAGARSVIASLWSVDDKATDTLMRRFYLRLREGKGPAQALRAAQLEVKKLQPSPFYWAPFVVVGPD
jgi:CHAT domain-containing protein